MIKSQKQAWWLYYNKAVFPKLFWEDPVNHSGLLLKQCPACGARQTRETYCKGFNTEFYTLEQGNSVRAVERCNCGQYLKVSG